MREALSQHFDVVVVVWALTLVLVWSVVSLSRADLTNDQWAAPAQHGPAWLIPSTAG